MSNGEAVASMTRAAALSRAAAAAERAADQPKTGEVTGEAAAIGEALDLPRQALAPLLPDAVRRRARRPPRRRMRCCTSPTPCGSQLVDVMALVAIDGDAITK